MPPTLLISILIMAGVHWLVFIRFVVSSAKVEKVVNAPRKPINIRLCSSGDITVLEVIGKSMPITRQPIILTVNVGIGQLELSTRPPTRYLVSAPKAPPDIIAISLSINILS